MYRCLSLSKQRIQNFCLRPYCTASAPAPTDWGAYFYNLTSKSSTIREKLTESICATSVESLLRQVRDFAALYEWKAEDTRRLENASLTDRLACFEERFRAWFIAMQAPAFVSLTEPWGFYPKARALRRKIIFHAGPTNAGKTHAALERLAAARSGIYCAPLKALAAQVWSRLNERVPCDLLIGDERIFPGFAEHVACTVEMTPTNEVVDVAVIDEVQLIEDPDRGWAWTRALLGVPAREVHLCGEFRALELVERLLYATREWERLEIVEHRRLVPLRLERTPIHNFSGLTRGDCLVVFSRGSVFKVKAQVERQYPKAVVSVIYGGLPFAVRQAECDAYNAGVARGDFHVLVTTDAIAYGLNMAIRRIIFTTTQKFNGRAVAPLSTSQILQIAGRAGRYGLSFADAGYVTACHSSAIERIRCAFSEKLNPIQSAGILPSIEILHVYAQVHPEITDFHELLCRYVRDVKTSKYFHVCDISRSLLPIAKALHSVPLALSDLVIFCFTPLSAHGDETLRTLRQWAEHHAAAPHRVRIGTSIDSAPLPRDLPALEWRFRMVEAYGWLAWRFQKTFVELERAKALKGEIVTAMKAALGGPARGAGKAPVDEKSPAATDIVDPCTDAIRVRLRKKAERG